MDRMLDTLRRYTEELERLRLGPREEFLSNSDKVGNAKYHFVVAIECCIDIAHHIIAARRYRIPSDNADAFDVLVEAGILPGSRAESYRSMARFRNRLVHLYWDVSDELVYDYLRDQTGQLREFAAAVAHAGAP